MKALVALLLPSAARAEGVETPAEWELRAWEGIYAGRLDAALARPPAEVAAAQEAVLARLPNVGSPLAAEAWYWKALAHLQAGDAAAARQCAEQMGPPVTPRERALYGQIEILERQIDQLPYRQDFDAAETVSPWVRAWTRGDPEDLSLRDLGEGNRCVAWRTVVRRGEDDHLLIPFAWPSPAPDGMRISLRAEGFPAHVRFVLESQEGQQWSGKVLVVPTDRWVSAELFVQDFTLVGDPRSGRRPDPKNIRALLLVDATGFRGDDLGPHTILVDGVEIL